MEEKPPKLYVLVRGDLTRAQQAIQAGHAVAEFLLEYPDAPWDNGTLIYLKVKDLKELEYWFNQMIKAYVRISWFQEPNLNLECTAIAALGVDEIVKGLPLLR